MTPDIDPERTLEQIRNLTHAVIDSSSIIYTQKCGIAALMPGTLTMATVPGVVNEVGNAPEGIRVTAAPSIAAGSPADPEPPVDDQVIDLAVSLGWAVISEDRRLLFTAAELELEAFNTLVLLELLLLRGLIDLQAWDSARKRLLAVAHYHPRVVHAGNDLHWAVRKEIG